MIDPEIRALYDELHEVTQRAMAALEPDGMDMQEWAGHAGRAAEIHEEIARRNGWRVPDRDQPPTPATEETDHG